jgi:MinD-like ATPase involved in chromosome partitioning or flagellar assembly
MSTIWPGSAYEDEPPAPPTDDTADTVEDPGTAGHRPAPGHPGTPGQLLAATAAARPPLVVARIPADDMVARIPADDMDTPVRGVPAVPAPAPAPAAAPVPGLEVPASMTPSTADLLTAPDPAAAVAAAPVTGWRRGVRVLTAGLVRPGPSREARELVIDTAAVGAQLAGPKTIVVANPKGGGGKTPTVVGLAATFGHTRGGRNLAWDNNETMGTLGVRTFPQRYATTVVDLLRALDHLEATGARAGDLAAFVRHQASGSFDVLVSDEDPGRMTQIDAAAFRRLHGLLTGVYELLVVDTGNSARSANFLAAIDVCDALVIPVSFKPDSVVSAGRLIDQLRAYGRGDLVERAVTVISNGGDSNQQPADVARWSAFFERTTAAVVHVPFDPHLAVGGPISFDQLAGTTRRAYLRAAAEVAAVLTTHPGQPVGWPSTHEETK